MREVGIGGGWDELAEYPYGNSWFFFGRGDGVLDCVAGRVRAVVEGPGIAHRWGPYRDFKED